MGESILINASSAPEAVSILTAEHGDAGAAAVALAVQQLDDADFAGVVYVGSAAGTAVIAGNLDDANRPGQCLFGPVGDLGKLLWAGIPATQGQILPYCPVGILFDCFQLLHRQPPLCYTK